MYHFKFSLKIILQALALGVVASVFVAQAHAADLDTIKKRGKMLIVTEDNWAPFNFMDGDKPDGFVNDIITEFKAFAPYEIKQDIIPWTGLLAAVSADKYDIALTGAIMTPDRLKSLSFTPPWAPAQHYAIIRAKDTDKIKTIADLDGLKVGVQAGSALLARVPELEVMLTKEGKKIGEVIKYQSYPEAFADLANGRLDYVIDSYLSAKALAKKRPNVFAVGIPVSGPGYLGFPMKKNNPTLMAYMVEFTDHIRKNGKLAELQKKWFGESFDDLPATPFTTPEGFIKATGWPVE